MNSNIEKLKAASQGDTDTQADSAMQSKEEKTAEDDWDTDYVEDPAVAKETLAAMEIGIALSAVALGAVFAIFIRTPQYFIGVAAGTLLSCLEALHMYHTIDNSLSMDEGRARVYAGSMSMARLLAFGALVVAACLLPGYINVLGVIVGMTGLKAGAFLVPMVLKVIKNKKEGEKECWKG